MTTTNDATRNATSENIRTAFARSRKALTLRPAMGLRTAVSTCKVTDGLRCEVEEGSWSVVADLSKKSGGAGSAPDPGVLGRAAFGSCTAMGYVLWAAHHGVELTSIEVKVEADFDIGGQYATNDARAGYTEIRYTVRVESPAPEADVLRVLDDADRYSSYHDVFAHPNTVVRTIELSRPDEG